MKKEVIGLIGLLLAYLVSAFLLAALTIVIVRGWLVYSSSYSCEQRGYAYAMIDSRSEPYCVPFKGNESIVPLNDLRRVQ